MLTVGEQWSPRDPLWRTMAPQAQVCSLAHPDVVSSVAFVIARIMASPRTGSPSLYVLGIVLTLYGLVSLVRRIHTVQAQDGSQVDDGEGCTHRQRCSCRQPLHPWEDDPRRITQSQ